MKKSNISILALTLGLAFVGCGPAESAPPTGEGPAGGPAVSPPSEPSEPAPAAVPAGASLTFAMNEELTTKVNKAGDAFSARLVSDFFEGGEVLLPAGTVLHGRVTESLESPRNEEPAVIGLAVESIETPWGSVMLAADVQEVEMETDAKDSNKLTAGKVAVGAVAGAVAGKIAGRTKTGAAVGTAAGAAVAIATRDGHATIPEGARLVVRLAEQLVVR